MDEILRGQVAGLLAEAKRIADEVASWLSAPDPLDAIAEETVAEFHLQRRRMEREIAACSAGVGASLMPERAAGPVWLCAGAILGLDIDDAEIIADRIEVVGDRIFGLARVAARPAMVD